MSWNYRIIEKVDSDHPLYKKLKMKPEKYYNVHEVYYDEKGRIKMWSKDPIHPQGHSVKELVNDIERMKGAYSKPIIKMKDLEKKLWKKKNTKLK